MAVRVCQSAFPQNVLGDLKALGRFIQQQAHRSEPTPMTVPFPFSVILVHTSIESSDMVIQTRITKLGD